MVKIATSYTCVAHTSAAIILPGGASMTQLPLAELASVLTNPHLVPEKHTEAGKGGRGTREWTHSFFFCSEEIQPGTVVLRWCAEF